MTPKSSYISQGLTDFVSEIIRREDHVSEDRKECLEIARKNIKQLINSEGTANLIFICTHNSRRSHFAQVWAQIASYHYNLSIQCYSGGTEQTAVYIQTLEALQESGIRTVRLSESQNPIMALRFSENETPILAFSKKYEHPFNPQSRYGAIMTCGTAEENCPYIAEASFRIPITYTDPKHSDDSSTAKEVYRSCCSEIASEMFYLMKIIAHA